MAVYQTHDSTLTKRPLSAFPNHRPISPNIADFHWNWLNLQTWSCLTGYVDEVSHVMMKSSKFLAQFHADFCLPVPKHQGKSSYLTNLNSLAIKGDDSLIKTIIYGFRSLVTFMTSRHGNRLRRAPERCWKNCSKMDRSHVGAGRAYSNSANLPGHIGPGAMVRWWGWASIKSNVSTELGGFPCMYRCILYVHTHTSINIYTSVCVLTYLELPQ